MRLFTLDTLMLVQLTMQLVIASNAGRLCLTLKISVSFFSDGFDRNRNVMLTI